MMPSITSLTPPIGRTHTRAHETMQTLNTHSVVMRATQLSTFPTESSITQQSHHQACASALQGTSRTEATLEAGLQEQGGKLNPRVPGGGFRAASSFIFSSSN